MESEDINIISDMQDFCSCEDLILKINNAMKHFKNPIAKVVEKTIGYNTYSALVIREDNRSSKNG